MKALKVDKCSKLKVSEADIERTCSDILALDGWRVLKTNPCSDRSRGKGFGEVGMADCLYIRYNADNTSGRVVCSFCQAMWIEWKASGGKATLDQISWQWTEQKRGAFALIAGRDFPASIEGFKEFYRKSGLMRKTL